MFRSASLNGGVLRFERDGCAEQREHMQAQVCASEEGESRAEVKKCNVLSGWFDSKLSEMGLELLFFFFFFCCWWGA
jgi:hypothetical protein